MAYRIRELNKTEAIVFWPLRWVIEADDGAAAWPAEPWLYVSAFRDLAALDQYVRMTGKEIER
jgi:hypothetical protein